MNGPGPAPVPSTPRFLLRGAPEKWGIRFQLLLLLLVVVLPGLVVVVLNHYRHLERERTSHLELAQARAKLVASRADNFLGMAGDQLAALTYSLMAAANNPRRQEQVLRDFATSASSIDLELRLNDVDGRSLATSTGVAQPMDPNQSLFREARHQKRIVAGDFAEVMPQGHWRLSLAQPVLDTNGIVIAVLGARLRLDPVHMFLDAPAIRAGMRFILTAADGQILATTPWDAGWLGSRLDLASNLRADSAMPLEWVEDVRWPDGVRRLTSSASVTRQPWVVHVGFQLDAATTVAHAETFRTAGLLAAALGASAVLALLFARRITRPLRDLAVEAASLGAGEWALPAFTRGNEVALLAQVFRRTTAQLREREASLRSSEQRFRSVFAQAGVGVAVVDSATGRILEVNECYACIVGMPVEKLLGRTWMELTHADDLEADLALMARLRAGEIRDYSLEKRLLRPDGTAFWIYLVVSAMWAPGEPPSTHIVILEDITERRQAREELRQNQSLLRRVLDSTPAAIFAKDADSRILFANEAMARIYFSSATEVVGQTHAELYARRGGQPAVLAKWLADDGHVIRTGQSLEIEETGSDSAGALHYFHTCKHPLELEHGRRGVLVISQDITERKEAEAALRASEERFRLLAQQAPIGIFQTDAHGDCLYVNPRWCELAGLTPAQARGRGWAEALHPDDRLLVREAWYADAQAGRVFQLDYRFRTPDGQVRWLLGKALAHRDAAGDISGYIGTVVDITGRKQAERELQVAHHQTERLAQLGQRLAEARTAREAARNVLEEASDLLGWDSAWVRLWDDASQKFLATISLDVIGGQRVEFTPRPEDPQNPWPMWRRVQTEGAQLILRQSETDATEGLPLGGSGRRSLSLMFVPLRHSGRFVGILSIQSYQRDAYTAASMELLQGLADHCAGALERIRAEDAVRQLNITLEQRVKQRTADLEAANKELESFSYSVSHDLRAPLRGIDGWSHALLTDYGSQLDDTARGYLDRVRSESQRLGMLIDDLLELARIARAEMRRAPVDLSALAQTIAARQVAAHPGHPLAFTCAPGLQATGDARLIEVLLANLLDNSWKFTGHTPQPTAEFGRTDTGEFFVRDNGAGFDPRYARRLFGAFQRLHTLEEFPGTGVGLAIVQRIVLRHGGVIRAESAPEQGTTFFFTLPEV